MNKRTDQIKDWEFTVDEISANVYKVRGFDKTGRSVERIGTNPEMLLSECKDDAVKLVSKT